MNAVNNGKIETASCESWRKVTTLPSREIALSVPNFLHSLRYSTVNTSIGACQHKIDAIDEIGADKRRLLSLAVD